MSLKFYNTLTRQVEDFVPLRKGEAGLYTCGPTVYNYAHIGNFRAYVFEDILRRTLKFFGYRVKQVMNLTYVDDKTIRDSSQAGLPLEVFTSKYKAVFFEDLKTLGIEPAEVYPAATAHIPEMIELIQRLMDKDFAYQSEDGSVYFSIAKFPDYGKLARVDLSGQRQGVRISHDEYDKESVADFALWKAWSEADGDVGWDSPWGRGRPGWHIECSAMSMKYLGAHFDIHTGGIDNMFPHHEGEITQSEAANGEKFVNYWLHCAHLIVNGEKMSKTLGNFFTLRDLQEQGWSGREMRYLLFSAHYRQRLNFTLEGLGAARTVLRRLDDFVRRLAEQQATGSGQGRDLAVELANRTEQAFRDGLGDDLNTPAALAAVFDFLHAAHKALDAGKITGAAAEPLLQCCRTLDQVLHVFDFSAVEGESVPDAVMEQVNQRNAARKARDFATADRIRDELLAAGWRIEDTPQGVRVIHSD